MIATNQTLSTFDIVIEGLSKSPRRLPSFLFYDRTGDELFRKIMQLPEYYLTRCEAEILRDFKYDLSEIFRMDNSPFELVELGAGDGTKTEILLSAMVDVRLDFTYVPVDVSANVLALLENRLSRNIPDLVVEPIHGRFEHLHGNLNKGLRKVYLYLGANIGNFLLQDAKKFVSGLAAAMGEEDALLIGFDLKKDPRKIISAYDDSAGVTRQFNLNLLTRLNREFGADFDQRNFQHYPTYDPESGLTRSFLVSTRSQEVTFRKNGMRFAFAEWETIHTEVSLKYDLRMIGGIAEAAGLHIAGMFYDSGRNFCDVLFKPERAKARSGSPSKK